MNLPHTSPTISRRAALATAGLLGFGLTVAPSAARQPAVTRTFSGVFVETLCSGDSTGVPGKALAMLRLTLHPGASAVAGPDAGPVALYVDAGILDLEMTGGQARVERALVDGMLHGYRDMAAGDATRLWPGDHLFHDGAAHVLRNISDEPVTLLASLLLDAGVAARTWVQPV